MNIFRYLGLIGIILISLLAKGCGGENKFQEPKTGFLLTEQVSQISSTVIS